jgi:hypothetical protein
VAGGAGRWGASVGAISGQSRYYVSWRWSPWSTPAHANRVMPRSRSCDGRGTPIGACSPGPHAKVHFAHDQSQPRATTTSSGRLPLPIMMMTPNDDVLSWSMGRSSLRSKLETGQNPKGRHRRTALLCCTLSRLSAATAALMGAAIAKIVTVNDRDDHDDRDDYHDQEMASSPQRLARRPNDRGAQRTEPARATPEAELLVEQAQECRASPCGRDDRASRNEHCGSEPSSGPSKRREGISPGRGLGPNHRPPLHPTVDTGVIFPRSAV